MTTSFMKNGEIIKVIDSDMTINRTLSADTNYSLEIDGDGILFLKEIDQFVVPSKLYGDVDERSDRIIETFEKRGTSTGVLLVGDKGSGKTMLSKRISMKCAAEKGMPTIVVAQPFRGPNFNTFLQSIEQPIVVLFDEFEKVYDKIEHQPMLLSMLDGVYTSKKLFVFTANESHLVSPYMINRPGRIFYKIDYGGLDEKFIREFCEDNLEDKNKIDSVVKASIVIGNLNFDSLTALVAEMNRYGETAGQALKYLNVRPDSGYDFYEVVSSTHDGAPCKCMDKTQTSNPFESGINVRLYREEPHPKDPSRTYYSLDEYVEFDPEDIVAFDANTKRVTFRCENANGKVITVVLEKKMLLSKNVMTFAD